MLRTLKDMEHYHVAATDADIGKVFDFYFDDQFWTIRYLVVDTGGFWHGPHRVLVSPIAFRQADWSSRRFHIALDSAKVKNSPTIESDQPVSRQYERAYHRYYGWSPYWGGTWNWGLGVYPGGLAQTAWQDNEPDETKDPHADSHLRSAQEVQGYELKGGKDFLGHIADFIVDDETWAIRYLVVDTRKWLSGKKVLIAPDWAREINWSERIVDTDLSRETLQSSPAWSPEQGVNREYEARLYDYHGCPAYWLDTANATEEVPAAQLSHEGHPTP